MAFMQNEAVHIAIRRADGGVSVMALLTVGRGNVLPKGARWLEDGWWSRPATETVIADEVAKVCATEGFKSMGWRVLKPGEVPQDRTYRDAWQDSGKGAFTHDMPKAREIHRGHLRKARAEALKDIDAQWMRATGQGDKVAAKRIEAERQRWRDAPADPRIEAAQTLDELRAILPAG